MMLKEGEELKEDIGVEGPQGVIKIPHLKTNTGNKKTVGLF